MDYVVLFKNGGPQVVRIEADLLALWHAHARRPSRFWRTPEPFTIRNAAGEILAVFAHDEIRGVSISGPPALPGKKDALWVL